MSNPFFPEIKPSDIDLSKMKVEVNDITSITERLDVKIKVEVHGLLPRTGGEWEDIPGDSEWKPDPDVIPSDKNGTNPEHKTWGEIMEEYGFESIPFKDGEPDFSGVAKGEVEIDDFTDDRSSNFSQADEKLAEQRGCTPEEVAQWRKEHKYT